MVALADPAQGGPGSVVLRSGDGGRSWLPSGVVLDGVVAQPGTLAVARKGFVLVPLQQRSAEGEVRVHCSADGGKWEACGAITGLDAQGSGVKRLTSSPEGVAAVTETGLERYAVHTSADGREWTRAADLGRLPGSLRALAVSGTGTLVVGGDERAAEVDNRLVLITAAKGSEAKAVPLAEIQGLVRAARETARVAAGEGRFVAVGSVFGDAGIWSSPDGEDWQAAGSAEVLGGAHRQALGDVAYGRKGWLAVGGSMSGASSTEPLLVTSADGGDWRRVPAADALKPAGDRDFLAPHAVAAGPSGYVLAGEERGAATAVPVLWFSADLKRYTRATGLPRAAWGCACTTSRPPRPATWPSAAPVRRGTRPAWCGSRPTASPGPHANPSSRSARRPRDCGTWSRTAGRPSRSAPPRPLRAAGRSAPSPGTTGRRGRRSGSPPTRRPPCTIWRRPRTGWWRWAGRALRETGTARCGPPGTGGPGGCTRRPRATWRAAASSGSAPSRSPATRWWPWAGPPPTTPTTSPCGARP
ncbi:hypothetical protein [Planomonospora algeriensis]